MCWYEMEIQPRDVLFFRDAKPMEASSVGEGAHWPWPNSLHDSLMSAFHHKWPKRQEWEFEHKNKNGKDRNWETSSMRFGGLKTVGVFPVQNGELCFPKPADIAKNGKSIFSLRPTEGESNLPRFLEYTVLGKEMEGKESAGEWIGASDVGKYIDGAGEFDLIKTEDIFDVESRYGIGIDPDTRTVDTGSGSEDEGGKFYIAEYMRLQESAGIKGFATCTSSVRAEKCTDVLEKFFEGSSAKLIFGGQRGLATVEARREEQPLPFAGQEHKGGLFIKWVLLTPAIFPGGWLPNWVDQSGQVCLPVEKPERKAGETRAEWRARFAGPIDAKLVAARIDKPRPVSGWSLARGGPRATRLAVPAGSVYYFRAKSEKDGNALVEALQGRCKSGIYGEKGFGFGFCAPVDVE